MSFTSGYPPPPFYYKEYVGPVDAPDLGGRPPPKIPNDSLTIFGNKQEDKPLKPLDSDTILYNTHPSTNLKEEFLRLYRIFIQELFILINSIEHVENRSNTHFRKILKIYTNLLHILSSLKKRQAYLDVIELLELQLQRRLECIDSIKRMLAWSKKEIEKSNVLNIN